MTNYLASNIDFILTNNKISQEEFGKLIGGVSGGSISTWKRGVNMPPLDKLIKISEEFDLSLDDLVFTDLFDKKSRYKLSPKEKGVIKEDGVTYDAKGVDKDQIIELLQNHIRTLESRLPETITGIVGERFDKLEEMYKVFDQFEFIQLFKEASDVLQKKSDSKNKNA